MTHKWLPEQLSGWIALAVSGAALAIILFGRDYFQQGWIGWINEAGIGILMLASGIFCSWQSIFMVKG